MLKAIVSVLMRVGTIVLEVVFGMLIITWLAFAGLWNRERWRELRSLLTD